MDRPSDATVVVSETCLRALVGDMIQIHMVDIKKELSATIREEFRHMFQSMHEGTMASKIHVDDSHGAISYNPSSSSQPTNSQSSSSSHESAFASNVAQSGSSNVAQPESSSSASLDELCGFDVCCPVCSAMPANEKSFYEHIKALKRNRHRIDEKDFACVLRPSNPDHYQLMSAFEPYGLSWDDRVCAYCDQLIGLLNPGSKRVYRPGGTGNNVRVRAFIRGCTVGGHVLHSERVAHAPQ
jgi:hypothetical protein